LREDPKIKPVQFIADFLHAGFDLHTIARFLITPERLATRDKVEKAVAKSLHRFVKTVIPELENPFWYTAEQAQKICNLKENLRSHQKYSEYSREYENPFNRHMSLRTLRRETGVSSENIIDDLKNGFALGSLWLEGSILTPNHSPVKQAIHDSVHRSKGGGVTLWEDSISDNITRIAKDRRMISLTPRMIGK
jgi:hypothetical protein